ncbi:DoxX family protein [Flavihumibacter rivuli]|uniref:DoxX family protein n=1 Tax=Flavihumibacter rivuli TaxID=2838156 RepID=UPI001EFB6D24|nr:DoxX family protein [Flavihumibacter rivuli]ULQ57993.1 DoxX family protein [Flavihumibacter rivuli]
MKKLLSTDYSDWGFNTMMFLLRITFGGLMLVDHGFQKLVKYPSLQHKFSDPFHIGSNWSLLLVIFAEVFCSILIIAGLFTRLAAIPLVIAMGVAFFIAHNHDFNEGEKAALFMAGFLSILLCGPGKASIDSMMGK